MGYEMNNRTNMADIVSNLLVAQSGGSTAVIDASVAGAIQEAGRHPEFINEIYGALNGIRGILSEERIDIQDEKSSTIEGLKHTPRRRVRHLSIQN